MRYLVSFVLGVSILAIAVGKFALGGGDGQLPVRRAGQWEIETRFDSMPNLPPATVQHCTDEATDRRMMEMGRGQCSRYDVRREGSNYIVESTCSIGSMSSQTRTEYSGDWRTSYTARSVSTGGEGKETHMTQTARHVGACRNGFTPGTAEMPNGMRININEMMRRVR